MFSTIFVAVPALSLVLPVSTSGPVTTSIGNTAAAATALSRLQTTATVSAPTERACCSAPITYGVRPARGDADDDVLRPEPDRLEIPRTSASLSSAPSTAFWMAAAPRP
jgi:hypothetical protein